VVAQPIAQAKGLIGRIGLRFSVQNFSKLFAAEKQMAAEAAICMMH
jgi:hypothetical protein